MEPHLSGTCICGTSRAEDVGWKIFSDNIFWKSKLYFPESLLNKEKKSTKHLCPQILCWVYFSDFNLCKAFCVIHKLILYTFSCLLLFFSHDFLFTFFAPEVQDNLEYNENQVQTFLSTQFFYTPSTQTAVLPGDHSRADTSSSHIIYSTHPQECKFHYVLYNCWFKKKKLP